MWLNARPRDNATLSNVVANLWPAGHMRSLVTVQSGIIPTKMLAIKAQVTTHTKNKKMQTPKSCGFICLFACSFVCLFTYKLTNPAHRLSINVAFRPDIPVCLGFTPLLKSRLQYCVKSLTQTTLFFPFCVLFTTHLIPNEGFLAHAWQPRKSSQLILAHLVVNARVTRWLVEPAADPEVSAPRPLSRWRVASLLSAYCPPCVDESRGRSVFLGCTGHRSLQPRFSSSPLCRCFVPLQSYWCCWRPHSCRCSCCGTGFSISGTCSTRETSPDWPSSTRVSVRVSWVVWAEAAWTVYDQRPCVRAFPSSGQDHDQAFSKVVVELRKRWDTARLFHSFIYYCFFSSFLFCVEPGFSSPLFVSPACSSPVQCYLNPDV